MSVPSCRSTVSAFLQFSPWHPSVKCVWHVLSICNRLSLNTETKMHVFNTYVSSVLNYGCEA